MPHHRCEAVNHLPTFPLSPCIYLFHPCPFPTPPPKKKITSPQPPPLRIRVFFFRTKNPLGGPISYRLPDEALQAAKLHGCEAPANNATKSEAEAETTILLRSRTPKVRQKNFAKAGKNSKGPPGKKWEQKKGPQNEAGNFTRNIANKGPKFASPEVFGCCPRVRARTRPRTSVAAGHWEKHLSQQNVTIRCRTGWAWIHDFNKEM